MSQRISFTRAELIGLQKALVYDRFQSRAKNNALMKIKHALQREG